MAAEGARPVGGLVTDFNAYPGVVEFTVDVDRYGVANDRCLYFTLPFTPRLFSTGASRRTLPLLLPENSDTTFRTRIKLPPEYRQVSISPRDATFKGPEGAGNARIISTTKNGECIVAYELSHRPAIIRPADYPTALGMSSALENKAARMVLLEKTATPPQ